MTSTTPGFSTLAVHAGAQPDPTTGARVTPIYQTTSFVFNDVDHAASLFGLQAFGNIFTRITNPTTAVLEERIAALEGGTAGLGVASGHAAQHLVFHTIMQPGDEFVASTKLYGGSINQFNHAFKNFGWHVKWANPDDLAAIEAAVTPKTKAIFIESIANPGGVITDIAAIAAIAHKHKIPLIVDNTLATPYLCRPFEHGADIIIHSATKFLGGHGNSIGGLIVDGDGGKQRPGDGFRNRDHLTGRGRQIEPRRDAPGKQHQAIHHAGEQLPGQQRLTRRVPLGRPHQHAIPRRPRGLRDPLDDLGEKRICDGGQQHEQLPAALQP